MASLDRFALGLKNVDPQRFEQFAQALLASELGLDSFVPTGGMHDGGADGVIGLFESDEQPRWFVQISKQVTYVQKVKDTLRSLRDEGRHVDRLILVTSLPVPKPDRVALALEKKHGVRIVIYGADWIRGAIERSSRCEFAWNRYVEPTIPEIEERLRLRRRRTSKHVQNVDALMFMNDELDSQRQGGTRERALDGLILWALEGTDPDAGVFRSRDELVQRIDEALPGNRLTNHINLIQNRLDALVSKDLGQREINVHPGKGYCLPYETRQALGARSAEDADLDAAFSESLKARLSPVSDDGQPGADWDDAVIGALAECLISTLHGALERQGANFALFLTDPTGEASPDPELATLEAIATELVADRLGFIGDELAQGVGAVVRVLRAVIYAGNQWERLYLLRVAQVFSLIFLVDAVPNVIDYFDEVTSDFTLFVGSDVIVRCLSEEFLPPEQQATRNLLALAIEVGCQLWLTQPVLEEVDHHLRNSNREYELQFASAPMMIDHDVAAHSGKILIRALHHARRLSPKSKLNWEGLINRFVDPAELGRPEGRAQLRDLLCSQFEMSFVSESEIRERLDDGEVTALADSMSTFKEKRVLRVNDAIMCLHVLGERGRRSESGARSALGNKTWWLTGERRIRSVRLHGDHSVQRIAMDPTFLAEWLAVTPNARSARRQFKDRFPTVQGLRITERIDPDVFGRFMQEVAKLQELPTARREAQLASLVDKLKSGDHFYESGEPAAGG